MKEITTQELQKTYDTWYLKMKPHGEDPINFWYLIKMNKDKSFQADRDAWILTPESEIMINIINSPYRDTLYKAWKIRHGNHSEDQRATKCI